MASFAVPCPKVSLPLSFKSSDSAHNPHPIANFPGSDSTFRASPIVAQFQGSSRRQSDVFKVAAKKSTTSASSLSSLQANDQSQAPQEIPDAISISDFMNQVSDLIKLVDSRDIVELQLTQMGCEVHIKKKEAMPQPSYAAPPAYSLPPPQQASPPLQTSPAASLGSASSSPTPASSPPAPTKKKSSHPPFKCPMAGNFYRCPAPGAPPFVKVGDKIQQGQVLCIIEAMKLMNEIESDQAGTVVEILVDDGKPVSIDTPLFVIEP